MADHLHPGWRSRGYLPHFDAPGAVQHIVFRLVDSLPPSVMSRVDTAPAKERFEETEAALDHAFGSRLLADPRAASIVQTALLHFDAQRYVLMAWCVMPTHVHVLLEQIAGWPVAQLVHGWKSYAAHAVNKTLARRGGVWAREYYDRWMRDEHHVETTLAYIEHNPVAARLCAAAEDWPWSSASRTL